MATPKTHDDYPRILAFNGEPLAPSEATSRPSPVSADLHSAFADTTGWTLKFTESLPSRKRRAQPGLKDSPVTGKLEIDDMSASWPAGVPTAHRGKCDKLVESLDQVFSKLQKTQLKICLLYTSPSPRDATLSRMPSSA